MIDVMHVFSDLLHQLDDTYIVTVSLLYMLEHRFYGKYPRQPVTDFFFAFIPNVDEFNKYLFSYIVSDKTYTY